MVMMLPNGQDADRNIVALFRQLSVPNQGASRIAGRPIFDDMDVCEMRFPGSRNVVVQPATARSHWEDDPITGEQKEVTYAERFAKQYRQFKEHSVQTKSGTPLDFALFLTEARRAEMRALNIHTIEALADVDGQELKNLGTMGRDAKNRAIEYLQEAASGEANRKLVAQMQALQEQNALLKEDITLLKARGKEEPGEVADTFDEMTPAQLRDYITTHSGKAPLGSLNRKTLTRMAEACKPKVAA